jgi:hypothetical protein
MNLEQVTRRAVLELEAAGLAIDQSQAERAMAHALVSIAATLMRTSAPGSTDARVLPRTITELEIGAAETDAAVTALERFRDTAERTFANVEMMLGELDGRLSHIEAWLPDTAPLDDDDLRAT